MVNSDALNGSVILTLTVASGKKCGIILETKICERSGFKDVIYQVTNLWRNWSRHVARLIIGDGLRGCSSGDQESIGEAMDRRYKKE